MCLNKRRIKNPHDGRFYWVKCNHCDACLQERANRNFLRINKEQKLAVDNGRGLDCFLVTLTYDNEGVPFINHSELLHFLAEASQKGKRPSLKVYRNVFNPSVIHRFRKIDFENRKAKEKFDFQRYIALSQFMPYLRKCKYRVIYEHLDDLVGVIFQPDIQKFFKRLKINLIRQGYEGYLSYFYTSEYGGDYKRPHIHILIYFSHGYDQLLRLTIDKSWPYSDLLKFRKGNDGVSRQSIEVAINPAAYISTYINLRSIVPPLFADAQCFKQKSHFSNGFGVHFKYFTPTAISEMFDKRTLRYPCRKIVNGVSTEFYAKVPRYVLSRYFPKFKGYNNLSTYEIFSILKEPSKINQYASRLDIKPFSAESHKIITYINSRRRCYFKNYSMDFLNRYEHDFLHYCYMGSRIWSLYASDSIVHSYDNVKSAKDLFEHFDNIQEFYESGLIHGALVDNYDSNFPQVSNPNDFKLNRSEHSKLKDRFDKSIKHHKLKNFYYSKQ